MRYNPQKPTDLILGRHESCDFQLSGDLSIALRQLIIRVSSLGQLPFIQLIDLRTSSGLADDQGVAYATISSHGAIIARMGKWHLIGMHRALVTPSHSADEAFESVISLVSLAGAFSVEAHSRRPRVRPRLLLVDRTSEDHRTQLCPVVGALSLENVDLNSPDAVGSLILEHSSGDICVRLTPSDLACGALIGRYLRCQLPAALGEDCHTISRVHLCLLLDEHGLWAIDLASKNGSRANDHPFRTIGLVGATSISLANVMTVRWIPAF